MNEPKQLPLDCITRELGILRRIVAELNSLPAIERPARVERHLRRYRRYIHQTYGQGYNILRKKSAAPWDHQRVLRVVSHEGPSAGEGCVFEQVADDGFVCRVHRWPVSRGDACVGGALAFNDAETPKMDQERMLPERLSGPHHGFVCPFCHCEPLTVAYEAEREMRCVTCNRSWFASIEWMKEWFP